MSDSAGGTSHGQSMGVPEEFEPAEGYDGYHAFLFGAGNRIHVVDPRTFDNSAPVLNPDGTDYEGYSANVGEADAHCGRHLSGRMCPLETDSLVVESQVCKTCRKNLERSEQDE